MFRGARVSCWTGEWIWGWNEASRGLIVSWLCHGQILKQKSGGWSLRILFHCGSAYWQQLLSVVECDVCSKGYALGSRCGDATGVAKSIGMLLRGCRVCTAEYPCEVHVARSAIDVIGVELVRMGSVGPEGGRWGEDKRWLGMSR
jgi:hypothetical protein